MTISRRSFLGAAAGLLGGCASTKPKSFTQVTLPEPGAVEALRAKSVQDQANALLSGATDPRNMDESTRGRLGAMARHMMRNNNLNLHLSNCAPKLGAANTVVCRSAQAVPAAKPASGPQ